MADLVQNCFLGGDAMDRVLAANGDTGVLRPYINFADGKTYVARLVRNHRTGEYERKAFVTNTAATLSYDSWKFFDREVLMVVRERLRAVADLRAAGLTVSLPNGMAHTMLQYQTQGDITGATVSMNPARRSETDRPETDTAQLPLPLVHKDFDIDARELMASQLGNMPLDSNGARLAARKVAEELENMLIGTVVPFKHGGNYVYGYRTLPSRYTKTDMPTPDGTNGPAVIAAILALRQGLLDDNHNGPFILYVNRQWSQYLDTDFSSLKGNITLRQRILAIEDIKEVRTLDRLPNTNWECLLVEMNSENVRLVVGTEIQTVQWESQGGMMRHYKVMAMQVPHLRPDANGNSGIGHGSTRAVA